MALHRGIQSAVFYYLSCAPCADARYRKKRKQEAERTRAEREALHAEMPELYRHPSPSSTNPHWQAEIAAGPTLASRGGKRKIGTGATTSSAGTAGGGEAGGMVSKTSMTHVSTESSRLPSSIDLSLRSAGNSRDGRYDSKLKFARYQREDEQSWEDLSATLSRSTLGGASTTGLVVTSAGIARPPRVYARDHAADSTTYHYRNPAINDLHPATVTKISSREEANWMMAPPPTAEVMSGKERGFSARSRSDSGGSSRFSAKSSSAVAVPLSREVSQRMIDRKLRAGETLPPSSPTNRSRANTAEGQAHDRSLLAAGATTTVEKDFATASGNATSTASKPRPLRVASRPPLTTITSDSSLPADILILSQPTAHQKENSHPGRTTNGKPSRLPPLVVKDDATLPSSTSHHTKDTSISDLKVLRNLAPNSPIFTRAHHPHGLQHADPKSLDVLRRDSAALTRRNGDPTAAATGEWDSGELMDPEIYAIWTNPGFELDEWVHQHTRREVRQRWSMDI